MKIERIRLKNFRALHDVELKNIPPLAVFAGKNGSGKSTLFQAFGFLKDALKNNVGVALQGMGGYKEVATRGHADEPIEIKIQFRILRREPTGHLSSGNYHGQRYPGSTTGDFAL